MRQVAHIVGRSLESRLPSLSASEGEIPRRDATLTASATGESRFRFESGVLCTPVFQGRREQEKCQVRTLTPCGGVLVGPDPFPTDPGSASADPGSQRSPRRSRPASHGHCHPRLDGREARRRVFDRLGRVQHEVFAEAGADELHALGQSVPPRTKPPQSRGFRLSQKTTPASARQFPPGSSRSGVSRSSPRSTPPRCRACSRSGRPCRHACRTRARSRCRVRRRPCSCR